MTLLLNFLAFQTGWFASVFGAAQQLPWLGPLAVTLVVTLHAARARRPQRELALVAVAMLLGAVLDSLLLASGWLRYPSGYWLPGLAPYWIIGMWGLFATTLNVSMRWLHGQPVLAMLMGAAGGPLSYLAGERLGGIVLTRTGPALVALALAWAIAMPLLMRLARHFDGVSEKSMPGFIQTDWRASGHD
jgi:hypothetical protein